MFDDYYNDTDLSHRSDFRICSCCASRLYSDFMILSGEAYCPDCVERLSTDDIVRLCEFSDVHQLLCELGFEQTSL